MYEKKNGFNLQEIRDLFMASNLVVVQCFRIDSRRIVNNPKDSKKEFENEIVFLEEGRK